MNSKRKNAVILIAMSVLLFSFTVSALASMTTTTKGKQYDDAVFELEEKLALWENYGEDPETRELERLRDVFSGLSGSSAQHSKGFRLYLDVLIGIAYCSYLLSRRRHHSSMIPRSGFLRRILRISFSSSSVC